jgi:hypothetical protein
MPVLDMLDPFRFERRSADRVPAAGLVPAIYTDGRGRTGLATVRLIDTSSAGVGLLTDSPIEAGMTITLRPRADGTPWMSGLAVSACDADGKTRVGMLLMRRAAA